MLQWYKRNLKKKKKKYDTKTFRFNFLSNIVKEMFYTFWFKKINCVNINCKVPISANTVENSKNNCDQQNGSLFWAGIRYM